MVQFLIFSKIRNKSYSNNGGQVEWGIVYYFKNFGIYFKQRILEGKKVFFYYSQIEIYFSIGLKF